MMHLRVLSISLAALVGASAMIALPVASSADETGMAGMHSWRKVGRKTCLSGHDHSGSGTGVNRKVAELEAIRSWSGFTDLEYGSDWANFNNAINKQMRCSSGMGGVQCDLVAVPCRPW